MFKPLVQNKEAAELSYFGAEKKYFFCRLAIDFLVASDIKSHADFGKKRGSIMTIFQLMSNFYARQEQEHTQDSQAGNAKLCGQAAVVMGGAGGIAGGKAGFRAGTAACGLPAVLFPAAAPVSLPGCVGTFTLGGAGLGTLGGLIAALNTPGCQNSSMNHSGKSGHVGTPSSSGGNGNALPPCPTHGVPHSCARPAPSRGAPSLGAPGHGFGCGGGSGCGGCR